MPTNIKVNFEGPLERLSRNPIKKVNLRPALLKIRKDYQGIMRQVYKTKRTPGYPWPPNKPRYIKYDKLKTGNNPGVRTGAVRQNYTRGTGVGAVNIITDRSIALGTSLKYANFSALGQRESVRGARIPASQVFATVFSKRRGGFARRKIPVRDPLLAIYETAALSRRLRRPLKNKWQQYIVDEIEDAILERIQLKSRRRLRQSRDARRRELSRVIRA